MIGEHECHYFPLLDRHCCRMKGLHTDRRPLQCSVHDVCYCAVLRDPAQNPNHPPQSRKAILFNVVTVKFSVWLCFFCLSGFWGWGLCFYLGLFVLLAHMLNLVPRRSLRFTLHVRGEERRPSFFICPSLIPSLLSGDGCHTAQSPPEMGSFHHAHTHTTVMVPTASVRMC